MRIWSDHVCMDERRPMALAAILGCAPKSSVTSFRIGAVNLFKMKIRKAGNQPRNASASRLHLHRDRYRVTVILDAKDYRQLTERSSVHGFPELTLARGAVAQGNVSDFVAMEADILETPVVDRFRALRYFGCLRTTRVIATRLWTTHRLEDLRAGRRRLRYYFYPFNSPVGGILAAA